MSKKVLLACLIVSVIVLGYPLYQHISQAGTESNQISLLLMDTVVDLRVDGRKTNLLLEQVQIKMESLEQVLSRFDPDSEISRINQEAGSGNWVKVSPETYELIELGIAMGGISEGAFDITIGALLDLWGFGSGHHRVPGQEEIERTLATVDYTKIELYPDVHGVRIPHGTVLDLGGIAKGHIVGQGLAVLREGKAQRAIINAGGDIAVIGRRPDNEPWRVGVQNPDRPSEIPWVLPLDNASVVTSGDYQRFFERNGQRYHHILDPKTGYPASGLRSVTIVGQDPARCDALSTAVFVLGWDKGRALVESLAEFEAILVGHGEVWISPGLARQVSI